MSDTKYPIFTVTWRVKRKKFEKSTTSSSYFIKIIKDLEDISGLSSLFFKIQYSPDVIIRRQGMKRGKSHSILNESITYKNVKLALKDARIFSSKSEIKSCTP